MYELAPQNPIITYTSEELHLEVKVENETVWLTQAQMVILFQRDRSVITKHIANIFNENELTDTCNVHFLHIANSDKPVKYYSLDVIISVGSRVKSKRGTQFRIWANSVLKEYLLKGYAINARVDNLEKKYYEHDKQIAELVQAALPPKQGIYFDGQIFDAFLFVTDLIKSAKNSIILIDNYIDESVLLLLSKRNNNVSSQIFTKQISNTLKLDVEKYNQQYSK